MSSRHGATWRSGYATVCKTVYTSSILVVASISHKINSLDVGLLAKNQAKRSYRDPPGTLLLWGVGVRADTILDGGSAAGTPTFVPGFGCDSHLDLVRTKPLCMALLRPRLRRRQPTAGSLPKRFPKICRRDCRTGEISPRNRGPHG